MHRIVKVTMHRNLKMIFLVHNCFPFIAIIIKLQTKTPLELRICLFAFEIKKSKENVTMH